MKKITFFIIIILINSNVNANYLINKWGIDKKEAIKRYCNSSEYINIDFKKNKQYRNILMTRFHALNTSLIDETIIIRTKKNPVRDLLFIKNKLYSIKEPYNEMDSLEFKKLYLKIKKIYGIPKVNKKDNVTTYSFKKDQTSVLLYVKILKKNYKITIYFYNYNWTAALLLEEFN